MWILPSLGRPERAQKVAEKSPDSPILLRLHWGDDRLGDYLSLKWPKAWTVKVDKGLSLTETLNWALETYPTEDSYGFLADDTLPEPEDWQETLEYYAGHWNIAYPDDGIHGKKLCTHHCIGGRLMRQVGWWGLPGLKHSFLDNAWYLIGANIGALRYIPQVKFKHLHELRDKSLHDETYAVGQSYLKNDKEVFEYWVENGAQETVNKLRTGMGFVFK